MHFHGAWLHFGGRGKIAHVDSTLLKNKRTCFSKGERFVIQLPLDRALPIVPLQSAFQLSKL